MQARSLAHLASSTRLLKQFVRGPPPCSCYVWFAFLHCASSSTISPCDAWSYDRWRTWWRLWCDDVIMWWRDDGSEFGVKTKGPPNGNPSPATDQWREFGVWGCFLGQAVSGVVRTWLCSFRPSWIVSIVLLEDTKRIQTLMFESLDKNKGFMNITFESPSEMLYILMKY